MTFASASQFHFYLPWLKKLIAADESFAALVARLAGHNANRAEQVPGCWAVYWCTVATLLHPPSHTLCSTHCNVQH